MGTDGGRPSDACHRGGMSGPFRFAQKSRAYHTKFACAPPDIPGTDDALILGCPTLETLDRDNYAGLPNVRDGALSAGQSLWKL